MCNKRPVYASSIMMRPFRSQINCAVDRLPDFECLPNSKQGDGIGPQHRGTVHFENKVSDHPQASLQLHVHGCLVEHTLRGDCCVSVSLM